MFATPRGIANRVELDCSHSADLLGDSSDWHPQKLKDRVFLVPHSNWVYSFESSWGIQERLSGDLRLASRVEPGGQPGMHEFC